MSINIRNLEWLDHNTERAYPLTVDSTKKDITDSFEIPDSFLAACYIAVPAALNVDPTRFFIQRIGNLTSGFSVSIAYDDGAQIYQVGTVNFVKKGFTPHTTYRINGLDQFYDATGWLVIGDITDIEQQPPGLFEFDLQGAKLEPDCIRPQIRAINSFRIKNGSQLSEAIYGDVIFAAGRNHRLTVTTSLSGENIITFNAIDGEGLNEDCICDENKKPDCIRTINGVPPDSNQNFTISPGTCIDVNTSGNGLVIEDTCTEPCCGNPELVAITEKLTQIQDYVRTLEERTNILESSINQLEQSVLGSLLGDKGCLGCS